MTNTTLTLGVNSSAVRSAASDLDRLSAAGRRSETATQSLGRQFGLLKGAFAGIAASVVAREVIRTADAYKSLGARLSLVTTNSRDFAAVQAALFTMAQDTRVGLEQTTDLYASLARSTESLGVSQSDLLGVTKTINQALVVSGTSASSASAALIQLGQGFAAGALRGDELNSVMEQAPRLARAIADGMGVSVGKLRELGAEGKITGETVFKALQKSAGQIDKEFKRMPLTVDQASTQAANALMKLIGVMDDASGSTSSLAETISGAAEWMSELAVEIEKASRGEEDVGLLASAFVRTTEAVKILYAYIKLTFEYFGSQIGAAIARIETFAEAAEKAKQKGTFLDPFGTKELFKELQSRKITFTAISDGVREDVDRAIAEFKKSMADASKWRIKPVVDPAEFAAMDVIDPTAKRSGSGGGNNKTSKKDPYGDAVKSLREQIALIGKLTEVEQVNARIGLGKYGSLSTAQKERLRSLAQELDAQKGLEALRKASTSTAVEKIKRDLSSMTTAYSAAESVLEELRTQGEVADRDYYEAKREFVRLNADAEVRAIQAENAALAQRKGTVEDRIADERQMAENTERIAQIRTEAAAKMVILGAQESSAIRNVAASLAEAEAAAQSYLDTLRRGQAIELGGLGLGNAERNRLAGRQQIEERYQQQLLQLESDKRQGAYRGREAAYEQDLDRIKRFQAAALSSYDEFYDQMQTKQGDASVGMSEALNNYLEDARNIAKQTEGLFTNAFLNMEDALVSFVTTGKLDFKSLANSIIADMARIAVKQSILEPLAGAMKGGGFGSLIAGLFGGNRAFGGSVSAGKLYEVNERDPELLSVGNRQYLMMGSQNGSVTPSSRIGGSRPVQVEVINNGQPARGQASVQETSTATLVRVVLDAVASDIGRGGRVAAAMKGRGVNLSGALPVRG